MQHQVKQLIVTLSMLPLCYASTKHAVWLVKAVSFDKIQFLQHDVNKY